MRDLDTIDSELRLIAAVRRSIREHGGKPSSVTLEQLLDAHLGHAVVDLAGPRQQSVAAGLQRTRLPPKRTLYSAPFLADLC